MGGLVGSFKIELSVMMKEAQAGGRHDAIG